MMGKNSNKFKQYTEVRFSSFLSSGFTTMVVMNPPEKKLGKRASVQWIKNGNNLTDIRLINNKFHGLSPSGGQHSLLLDQEFQKMAGWN